jgi:hypothetical protein
MRHQFNAAAHGASDIITEVVPGAFGKGRAGVVVRLALQNRRHVA